MGMKCVSAPVRGLNNEVIAAISISGPKERFKDEIGGFITVVKDTAEQTRSFKSDLKHSWVVFRTLFF